MQARFTTAVLFGVALIALGACGGGGSGDEDRLRMDLEAAQEAAQEAEEARRRAEAEAAEAERQRREAEAEAEQARQDTQDAADAEAARQAAEAAQQAAEAAQRQAEEQQEELQQQLTEAEQAELRARASSFGAQLDGPGTAPATISWTRGTTLTFRPQGIVLTPGSAAPGVPGSWTSSSFTGQSGTVGPPSTLVDETVYLYTNIQAPSSRVFWKEHNVEVASPAEDNSDFDPTPTAAAQYITDSSDNTLATGLRVAGTYDGVSGTYTCDTGTCVGAKSGITLTDFVGAPVSGVRSFAGGDWSFTPGNINTRVKVDQAGDQDDAYLYFGIWSSIPDNITGTYDFRYVAGGGAESGTDLANFAALTGVATYSGGAVGKYVTQGQVGQQNAKIGTFTATATLNIDFGDGTAPGTLSGSITDFKEGGSSLTGWRVTMGSETNVAVASTIADAAASGSTVANIGGLPVGGSWGANFYGSDNAVIADREKYPASQFPVADIAGVTGWFDATGADASLAGAFAATP